jgi:hypothetical protein
MHGLHAKVNNMAAILKQLVFIVAAAIVKNLFVWSLADVSRNCENPERHQDG